MQQNLVEFNFFRVEKHVLKFFGISLTKNDSFLYKIYSYAIVIFLMTTYEVIMLMDLLTQPFETVIESWTTFFGLLLVLSIGLTTFWRRVEIGELINKLENGVFVSSFQNKTSENVTILWQWHKSKNIRSIIMIIMVFITCGLQTVYTLLSRLNKDPENWKLYFGDITLVNTTHSPNFEIVFVYQSLSVTYAGIGGITGILAMSNILEYVALQFKVLQNNLKTLLVNFESKSDQNSTTEWIFLRNKISEFVLYHNSVIEIIKKLEDIFSRAMLLAFNFSLLASCLHMYRASLMRLQDFRITGIFAEASCISALSFLICKTGEQIATESELLKNAVYEIDFVGTNTKFQKSLIMIMRKTQNPVRVKAGKFVDVSVVTYASIIRASYSAYVMLKEVNKSET